MAKDKVRLTVLNILAIMSAYTFAVGMMAVNPIIQLLSETYPEVSLTTIKMVSTLPSLISSGVMIIIGFVVGRKLKYKTTLILANICLLIGGVLPIVWNAKFAYVLIARTIFGFGMGAIGCRNALVIASFNPEDRTKYMGYGIFFGNVMGVAMQVVTGWLAEIGLTYAYLLYFIAIIPLILIAICLKEPESTAPAKTDAPKEKLRVKGKVWFYAFVGFMWCVLGYSIMTNMSTYIQNKELGTSGIAGTILCLYVLGGAVSAAFASRIYKALKRWFVPVCFAAVAIGEALVLIGLNIPMIAIGTALAGAAWYCLNPNIMSFTGTVAGARSQAFCGSIVLAATQIGVFVSSYFGKLMGIIFGNEIIATKWAAIIGFGTFAIAFVIYDIRPKEDK